MNGFALMRAKGLAAMPTRIAGLALALAVAVSAFVALAPDRAEAYSSKLRRYPYLTDVVGTSATINWATDRSSTTASVKWGEIAQGTCTALSKTATRRSITVTSVGEYQWKARLTLKPNTEYCYRVYLGSSAQDLLADDPSPRFVTQLPAGSQEPFSFAVLGDWGEVDASGQNPQMANLMRQIAQSGARFVVTPGDNTHPNSGQTNYGDLVQVGSNTSAVFGPAFWTVPGASLPIFPALGNHGISNSSVHLANWPQDSAVSSSGGRYATDTYCCLNGTKSGSYGSAWYAFDAGSARFYVLQAAWSDTNVGTGSVYKNDYDYHWSPTSAEYQWLENDLATHPSALKFAFFHYPLYTDNKKTTPDTFLQGPASLEGLLSRYGVDIAFNGHAHTYQRNLKPHPESLVTYVTGGGGARPAPVGDAGCSPFDAYAIGWSSSSSKGYACGSAPVPTSIDEFIHFLKVTVNGTQVTVTPINSLGASFDEVSYDFGLSADLSVTQSDLPDPASTWQPLTYTSTVRNDGPSPATAVTFKDKLPKGVSFSSATPSQGGCTFSSGTVTCGLGTLESGATATVDVVAEPQRAEMIASTATVHASEFDPNTANNSATEQTTVELPEGTLAFNPTDDALVRADTPTGNYGSGALLELDATPVEDVLMRFSVAGIGDRQVTGATLRLYCVGGSTRSGGDFYAAADNGWLESNVTWNTAPPADGVLLDALGGVSPGNWYEIDLTSLVTGNGVYNLRVSSVSSDSTEYSSKEDPLGLAPQLVVRTG